MGAKPSLYEVLGVPPDATADQIRHAYRAAARRTHPDAGGSAPAFAQVNVAYRVLGDPGLRRRYDLRLADPDRPRTAGPSDPPTESHHPQAGPYPPGGPSSPAPQPGADPVVRRRYLILMSIALALFIAGGTVVRLYSLPAALIMMAIAAIIPPVAVVVAGRPRLPPDPNNRDRPGRRD
ncbi:J domain-containing protein [Candidatus Frankia alpina]|uniref:J domain-containing protein n=1 Tax=Candidatus Frankia alpina TaxID=2699483 RepID=UPI0013D2D933|nr:DnaJ domain-containing protein [Candidatus Frankia alpina]